MFYDSERKGVSAVYKDIGPLFVSVYYGNQTNCKNCIPDICRLIEPYRQRWYQKDSRSLPTPLHSMVTGSFKLLPRQHSAENRLSFSGLTSSISSALTISNQQAGYSRIVLKIDSPIPFCNPDMLWEICVSTGWTDNIALKRKECSWAGTPILKEKTH